MTEIIVVVGYPAAGKSTICEKYEDQGFIRINRDQVGGTLKDLLPLIKKNIEEGNNIILDNTYGTKESRAPVIALAKECGIVPKCIWLATSIEDAQFNACFRMIQRFGKVLTPEEIKKKKDPNTFPAAVLFKYKKEFEKPTVEEGFSSVEKVKFERILPDEYCNSAFIFDYDGTLRVTKSGDKYPTDPEDIQILPNRVEKLQELKDQDALLLGMSNQSGVEKGKLTDETAKACFEMTNKLLGTDIEYAYCPHKVPPISCYCRKPMPGKGVEFIVKYKLDPKKVIMVGDYKSDETFAKRCGFQYEDANKFFGDI